MLKATKAQETNQNKYMKFHQAKKVLQRKGNNQQIEETTYRNKENS